jgi:hypothetical protein
MAIHKRESNMPKRTAEHRNKRFDSVRGRRGLSLILADGVVIGKKASEQPPQEQPGS